MRARTDANAFVVQFRMVTPHRQFEGVVEEVDTGEQIKFHSERELIDYLRGHFARTKHNHQRKDEKNEPTEPGR